MVGLSGLEPPTSRLSGVRSNQLSYRPLERVKGIEPSSSAWKAEVLPLNYTRLSLKMAVPTGIEPAISCVTGRHVNRYTTGPCYKVCLSFTAVKYLGDPYGIRTRVTAVKGRCLNHLTKGPSFGIIKVLAESKGFEPLRQC